MQALSAAIPVYFSYYSVFSYRWPICHVFVNQRSSKGEQRSAHYELPKVGKALNLIKLQNAVPQSVRLILLSHLYGTTLRDLTEYETVSNVVTHHLRMSPAGTCVVRLTKASHLCSTVVRVLAEYNRPLPRGGLVSDMRNSLPLLRAQWRQHTAHARILII